MYNSGMVVPHVLFLLPVLQTSVFLTPLEYITFQSTFVTVKQTGSFINALKAGSLQHLRHVSQADTIREKLNYMTFITWFFTDQ